MSAVELDERSVPAEASGERLDKVVAKLFGVSRGRAMEWIADGRVRIDGRRAPKGAPVQPGARIRVERRGAQGRWVLAVDAPLQAGGRYAVAVPGAGVYRVLYAGNVAGPSVRVR